MKTARLIAYVAALSAISLAAAAQSPLGSLRGTVFHPDGSALAKAPVQARNEATQTDARTYSAADGSYQLRNLPAGTYTVSVTMPCCAFDPFAKGGVVVAAGKTLGLDIRLKEGGSLNVLGDDPATINAELRKRQHLTDQPVPRTADGRPDLSGAWLTSDDPYPQKPDLLPRAAEIAKERTANGFKDHPHDRCLPGDPAFPGATAFMVKFVQTPKLIVLLFEDLPGFRQVFLDGRKHPAISNPSWVGHSVGHWEGDTLVVDTVGFNSRGWTDIYPRTEKMHMEERFRRTDFGHLQVRVTVQDPGVFAKPYVRNATWDYAPHEDVMEYVCENNKWAPQAGR